MVSDNIQWVFVHSLLFLFNHLGLFLLLGFSLGFISLLFCGITFFLGGFTLSGSILSLGFLLLLFFIICSSFFLLLFSGCFILLLFFIFSSSSLLAFFFFIIIHFNFFFHS